MVTATLRANEIIHIRDALFARKVVLPAYVTVHGFNIVNLDSAVLTVAVIVTQDEAVPFTVEVCISTHRLFTHKSFFLASGNTPRPTTKVTPGFITFVTFSKSFLLSTIEAPDS